VAKYHELAGPLSRTADNAPAAHGYSDRRPKNKPSIISAATGSAPVIASATRRTPADHDAPER